MCTYKIGVCSCIEEYNIRWVYTKFVWDKCYTNVILVTLCQRVCMLVSCHAVCVWNECVQMHKVVYISVCEMSETSFM